jgi:hypothetical protein
MGRPLVSRRGASDFRGVRPRPNGTFYAELRAGGYRLTLGTYNTTELAVRVFNAVAWRFRRPWRDRFSRRPAVSQRDILRRASRRRLPAHPRHLQHGGIGGARVQRGGVALPPPVA